MRGPRGVRRFHARGTHRRTPRPGRGKEKEVVVMPWDSQRSQISSIAVALFIAALVVGLVTSALAGSRIPIIVGTLVGLYLLFSIRVADQWERVAVLRLGRYLGLRGPGWFHMFPIIDSLSRFVDQRVRTANVSAESTLTRDTVPVNVDAIVFWMVWNAEKSILEVQDFVQAITMSAQTALRESIGRHELAQMITGARIARPRTAAHPRRK